MGQLFLTAFYSSFQSLAVLFVLCLGSAGQILARVLICSSVGFSFPCLLCFCCLVEYDTFNFGQN